MSQDDNDDQLPSGFAAQPYTEGQKDLGFPDFPESLWLSLMEINYLDGIREMGYRLLWGSTVAGADPEIDGELWLTAEQASVLFASYQDLRRNETPEE